MLKTPHKCHFIDQTLALGNCIFHFHQKQSSIFLNLGVCVGFCYIFDKKLERNPCY